MLFFLKEFELEKEEKNVKVAMKTRSKMWEGGDAIVLFFKLITI